ncbi:MAG: amidohydrolase family protein [Anaerolineae bacterium]|jgi:imidazolonepropionase-like amidohydrolase
MRLILRGGTLFDGTGAPARPATVTIRQGRIEAVLEPGDSVPEGQVLDCAGKFVLPGLIDSHVHLAFAAGPDHKTTRDILAGDDDATLLLRQTRHAQQCLLAGITTVRDCGGRGLSTLALRDAIGNGLLAGPRIVACGMPITTTAGHLHFCGYRADSVDEVRKAARSLIESGADFIKVMATGGNMTPGTNPARPQYSQEELSALVEDAHRLGRKVAAHVGAREGIRRCLEAGVDTLEHGNWLNPDGTLGYDPELAEGMARQGAVLGLAVPGIDRVNLLAEAGREQALEALHAKYEPFRRMRAAGVPIMVSSDAGVRMTPFDGIALSLQAFSFAMDASPAETLVAATATPARALGLEDEIGTIVAGKRADILVVEGDPLSDLGALRQVHLVLRDGAIAVQQGRLSLPVL